jgi:hypothetical protein
VAFVVNDFGFPITRSRAMSRSPDSCSPLPASFSRDPTPYPLCTPNSTQGHPRIGRGSHVISGAPLPPLGHPRLA